MCSRQVGERSDNYNIREPNGDVVFTLQCRTGVLFICTKQFMLVTTKQVGGFENHVSGCLQRKASHTSFSKSTRPLLLYRGDSHNEADIVNLILKRGEEIIKKLRDVLNILEETKRS